VTWFWQIDCEPEDAPPVPENIPAVLVERDPH
jgi:hypothetical protein